MTMPNTFQDGTDWQVSSGPYVTVNAHEANIWPIDDNSISGTKDAIGTGLHPVVAIGDRAIATAERANQPTGVVVSYTAGLTTATGLVRVNVARGMIIKQWVSNVLTYNGGAPATFVTAPVPGTPVYVDDSDDLSAGVTLSMSPLSTAGTYNPLAGWLWYDQDEYADAGVGGPNATATFDTSLSNSLVEQEYAVLLK